MKAVSREKRAADARVGALEVDLKAVLAKHAREVESATTARRDANRSAAAKQAADSEIKRMLGTVRPLSLLLPVTFPFVCLPTSLLAN